MGKTQPAIRQPSVIRLQYFRRIVLAWYRLHGRMFPWRYATATHYRQIVAEVLLQRTRAETVAGFFPRFVRTYPNWRSLANSKTSELRAFLRPLGLWRRRSKDLHALALVLFERNGRIPEYRAEAERLPGVGQYVANAMLLFAHRKPQPLLDGNMARVLERYFGPRRLADIRYDPYLQRLAHRVVSVSSPKVVNWAILDFAALVCKSTLPNCTHCPLRPHCRFLAPQRLL